MERSELIEQTKRVWDAFFASPPEPSEVSRYAVRTTSGTTSGKPILLLNKSGPRERVRFGDAHNILMCMGSINVRLSHVRHVRRTKLDHPMHVLPLSANDLTPELETLIADFAPDQLYGISGFVGRAAEHIDTATAKGIRNIWLCGEGLSSILHERFQRLFPDAPIRMEYIVTELGGPVGIACEYLPPNQYHPAANLQIEISDPDATGAGEILVTKDVNEFVRAEKYRVGDTIRMLDTQCPCGEKVTFQHLGRRGYDYIKVAGAIARKEEFDRVAALFSQFIDDYRAEVGEKIIDGKVKGSIVLRIFRKKGAVTGALCEEIGRDFSRAVYLTLTQTLADLVAKDLFLPLTVEFVPTPFSQKHKDIKLLRMLE